MNILRTLIMALATRRITALITQDKITEDLRAAILKRYPAETTKLGYLVTCPKCSSVWAGVAVGLLGLSGNRLIFAVLEGLAFSEVTITADKYIPAEFDL